MSTLHDTASERAVLGSVFLVPEAIHELATLLSPDDFAKEAHGLVFSAMLALAARREPIDTLTVTDALTAAGTLEPAGGLAAVAILDAAVPTSGNYARYAATVRDLAQRRRLVEACTQLARNAGDMTVAVADTLQHAEVTIHAVADAGLGPKQLVPVGRVLQREFEALQALYERQTDVTGLATGLGEFDRMTSGLQNGDLIVLAGRPSMGKTALAMSMAAHVVRTSDRPVIVFEQEMSDGSLVRRLLASEGRVEGQRIRTGRFLDSDWPKLARAAEGLFRTKLFLDDTAGVSLSDIRSRSRRVRQKYGPPALIVVDYIGLMRASPDAENREQAVAELARGLKGIAREFECPVIALSQLNRGVENRADKRPQMSDLRESGAIEQDADVVAFVYRDEVYDAQTALKGVAEIIIAKQRNGPIGTAHVAFLADFTRFEGLPEGWTPPEVAHEPRKRAGQRWGA